ncbi:MAG: GNAT family N-acetyltransferase [Hyphomicrobium sp.]
MTELVIRTRADSAELKKAAVAIEQSAWNDLGYLGYTRAHYELYAELLDLYGDYQLCLVDQATGYPVAVANCVPLWLDGDVDLPAEGWDWVVEQAARSRAAPRHNTLGALAISVPKLHRAKGYARMMIAALLDLVAEKGLDRLIAPVRPSAKARHLHVPIATYVTWTDDHGRSYDPWLRSHLAAGGRIVKPCERSMVVEEPLGFWETWSNQRFLQSGAYEVSGALVPVQIDVERRIGRYEEPNVWVTYPTDRRARAATSRPMQGVAAPRA